MTHEPNTKVKRISFGETAPKFCWECGRKLRGKFKYVVAVYGVDRTVHKACGERMEPK